MKLYATVQSERATKGQGGKELMIEIMGEKNLLLARVKVTKPEARYQIEVFPVSYPSIVALDVKGHGYQLKNNTIGECMNCSSVQFVKDIDYLGDEVWQCPNCRKGEKKKGEN